MPEINEKEYTKGFNNGYTISKYEPELSDKILKTINPESDYFKGMNAGGKQYKKEKEMGVKKYKDQSEKEKGNEKGKEG